ncbi:hypothetical protein FRB94_011251 [Tulasnella sp. JGI-2019a]|nr:hypothetical protein FRB94_011251 [Tulasnella sp. JGI-2019a]
MEDGNKLVLTDDQNVMNEWDIQDKGNGNYSITSRKTQQAIDLDGGHAKDGTSVSVYGFHGGEQQEWQFQRA